MEAESLYDAVARAVSKFRTDGLREFPVPMTEFTVSVQRPPVEHRIRLGQVTKWAEGNARWTGGNPEEAEI